jgi:hypothetical protein
MQLHERRFRRSFGNICAYLSPRCPRRSWDPRGRIADLEQIAPTFTWMGELIDRGYYPDIRNSLPCRRPAATTPKAEVRGDDLAHAAAAAGLDHVIPTQVNTLSTDKAKRIFLGLCLTVVKESNIPSTA